jgi:endoglycosylceramidase
VACEHPAELDAGSPDAGPLLIRDREGGVLVLRGTNVEGESKNTADLLPPHYATSADFARLREMVGFSAIRLLVFWEAIEPTQGVYDEAYLAAVRARVEAAGAAGLLVIVDMHQDVYGRGFGFDGAPRWSCDEALYASFTPPAEWFFSYFEPEVQACFDRLWTDPATRAAFGAAWARLAQALRGAPGLFGYELLNEPSPGSLDLRRFETQIAPAAYTEWIDAIRAVDPDPYVLIEPASNANIGLASSLVAPDRERVIYAPHVYPAALERGGGWFGTRESLDDWMDLLSSDAQQMGLPLVVTEVGARADVPGALTFLDEVFDAFDGARLGATQWEGGWGDVSTYAIWDVTGAPSPIARAIARPTPARIAGTPISWSWDAVSGTFVFSWNEDASGDTLVIAPTLAFPSGFDAALDDGGAVNIDGTNVVVPAIGGLRTLTLRVH